MWALAKAEVCVLPQENVFFDEMYWISNSALVRGDTWSTVQIFDIHYKQMWTVSTGHQKLKFLTLN